MRSFVPASLLAFLAIAVPPARADEPPAAEETPAEAPSSPKAAWAALMQDVQKAPPATRRTAQGDGARGWLDAHEEAVASAEGEELLYVARLQGAADRPAAQATSLLTLFGADGVSDAIRDDAASTLATLLANKTLRAKLDEDLATNAESKILEYVAAHPGGDRSAARGRLYWSVASLHDAAGRSEEAIQARMRAALDDAQWASPSARSIVSAMLSSTHEMGGYEPMRRGTKALLDVLLTRQRDQLAELKAQGAEGRALDRAEAGLRVISDAGAGLELLGREAPTWTVEHAFGKVASLSELHGKVVLVDFWATWCPWCIKSFPAIRDLLKDYGDRGFAVIGATTTSSSVYAARYDLDDDLKAKATPGERVTAAAYREREGGRYPEGTTVLPEAEYREKEKAVIGEFIRNHEMTWPVVMIDSAEPKAKFALQGWPHAVLIDRAGRIRYLKIGALLRDRTEQVAAFRKVVEDLLAEDEGTGQ